MRRSLAVLVLWLAASEAVAQTDPLPVISLSASPASVAYDAPTSLSWSATAATSCTGSGGWSGTGSPSGLYATPALTTDTVFTIVCSGPGGSATQSITVAVAPNPNGTCGSAAGAVLASAPTAGLCGSGTASNMSGSGPWTWSCLGQNGGATTSCLANPLPTDTNACLPAAMPSTATLLNSSRKVLSLYYGDIFDLSRDNLLASQDYYNSTWLQPVGPWAPNGGFLRTRPLPVPPSDPATYRDTNFQKDIRLALARGITGFAYSLSDQNCAQPTGGPGCLSTLKEMLAAASEVNAGFKIALAPDAHLGADVIAAMVEDSDVYQSPNIYKVDDKIVVMPWWDIPELQSALQNLQAIPAAQLTADQQAQLATLQALQITSLQQPDYWNSLKQRLLDDGHPIYFVPIYSDLQAFAPFVDPSGHLQVLDSFALVNTAVPSEDLPNIYFGTALSNLSVPYMAGVATQGFRPKEYRFWESQGSNGFRNGWMSAINALNEDTAVLLFTWNDFSETTIFQPYTDATLAENIGTGFYNLTGYYAAWFLTGQQPSITNDVLYYFYRKQSVTAAAPSEANPVVSAIDLPVVNPCALYQSNPCDMIELVAFLQAPGNLSVTIGGQTYSSGLLQPGIQSFAVPLAPGTPTFSLIRNGAPVISFAGPTTIVDSPVPGGYADLTYWSGSASSSGLCSIAPQ